MVFWVYTRIKYISYNRTTTQGEPVNYTEMSIIEMTITNGIMLVSALAVIFGYHVILNRTKNTKKK